MNRILGNLIMAALLAGTGIAGASTYDRNTASRSDAEIAKSLTHESRMYPRYTIWDGVSFRVVNGQVELMGAVSQPFKKADLDRIAKRVEGVTSVTDEIKVLPLSPN